jgi:hypothetical protein
MGNSISPDTSRQPQPFGVGLYRRSVAIFLATLVLFMVSMPFAPQLADPGLLEGPLIGVTLITGVKGALVTGSRSPVLNGPII